MLESFRCIHYDHCSQAAICLRCLIPIKHSEEEGLPCCFRQKEVEERRGGLLKLKTGKRS